MVRATKHVALVVETIRAVVAEDWVQDYEIGRQTRFSCDMEIDSLAFVRIVDAIQAATSLQRGLVVRRRRRRGAAMSAAPLPAGFVEAGLGWRARDQRTHRT